MKLADKAAFACASDQGYQPGITLLEHYAGLAMQGFITMDINDKYEHKELARNAVIAARALIAELEKVRP